VFIHGSEWFCLRVVPKAHRNPKRKSPQLQKEIVKIKFVQASQIKNLLNPYLSRYGSIRFDERLQMLTLQDTPEIVDKVLAANQKDRYPAQRPAFYRGFNPGFYG